MLYGAQGQNSLPECADSVAAYIDSLLAKCGGGAAAADLASSLNADITAEEVQSVLRRLKNGRMAGPDGVHSELFRFAYDEVPTADGYCMHDYLLAPDLCTLLQHAFATGQLPPAWCSAILCAVFKHGDPGTLDNYRGIAVGSALGKIFSMVLEQRLDAFCERNGFRAVGQAGFRRKRRCSDHVFVLKHLIDRSRASGSHLFACFVDFRKGI